MELGRGYTFEGCPCRDGVESLANGRDHPMRSPPATPPFTGIPHPNTSLAHLRPQNLVEEDWPSLGFLIHSHPFVSVSSASCFGPTRQRHSFNYRFHIRPRMLVIFVSIWIEKIHIHIYIYVCVYIYTSAEKRNNQLKLLKTFSRRNSVGTYWLKLPRNEIYTQ